MSRHPTRWDEYQNELCQSIPQDGMNDICQKICQSIPKKIILIYPEKWNVRMVNARQTLKSFLSKEYIVLVF